jgi:acyl carrier protein
VNRDELGAAIVATLQGIAPELEAGELQPDRLLREQVDLDSMDWLNFLVAVHERFGVDIPEADYARLATLDAIVDYVRAKRRE